MRHFRLTAIKPAYVLTAILLLHFVLCLIALLLTWYVARLRTYVVDNDAIGYIQLASNAFAGRGYHFDVGTASAFRMPGYPAFLAVTYLPFGGPLLTQLVQIGISLATVALVWWLGRLLQDRLWIAALGACFYALNPAVVFASVILYPEQLAILAVTCMVFVLILRRVGMRWAVLLGFLAAISVYFKPSLSLTVSALLVLYAFLCFARRGQIQGAWFVRSIAPLAVLVLTLAPWSARNLLELGTPVIFTTSDGANLYGGNNAFASGGFYSDVPFVVPGFTEVASSRLLTDRAVSWIKANPREFLQLLPQKAYRLFHPLTLGTKGQLSMPELLQWLLLWATSLMYATALLGLLSLLCCKQFWLSGVLATPTVALLTTSLISFGAARFLLPAVPTIALCAAIGVGAIVQLVCDRLAPPNACFVSEL